MSFIRAGNLSHKFRKEKQGHFDYYPLLCCLLRALRIGRRGLYKLKAALNAGPTQLMRGSLQNIHEMMLSNRWHKNAACNPPVQTLGVNMPAPPFSLRLLPVQTIALPPLPPWKHNDSSANFSKILGCLRPMKQRGIALIISFIHIVGKTPLLLSPPLCFSGLKLLPLKHIHSECVSKFGCIARKWNKLRDFIHFYPATF